MNETELKAELFDKIFNQFVKESCLNEKDEADGCVEFQTYENLLYDGNYILSYELHGDDYSNEVDITKEEYDYLSKLIKDIEDKEKEK